MEGEGGDGGRVALVAGGRYGVAAERGVALRHHVEALLEEGHEEVAAAVLLYVAHLGAREVDEGVAEVEGQQAVVRRKAEEPVAVGAGQELAAAGNEQPVKGFFACLRYDVEARGGVVEAQEAALGGDVERMARGHEGDVGGLVALEERLGLGGRAEG